MPNSRQPLSDFSDQQGGGCLVCRWGFGDLAVSIAVSENQVRKDCRFKANGTYFGKIKLRCLYRAPNSISRQTFLNFNKDCSHIWHIM